MTQREILERKILLKRQYLQLENERVNADIQKMQNQLNEFGNQKIQTGGK